MGIPDLSVVVTHYEYHDLLPACLASIRASTLSQSRYEIIVVDNASPSGIPEAALAPDIIFVRHGTDRGWAASLNTGYRIARGQYVCHVSADDTIEPGWLERGLELALDQWYLYVAPDSPYPLKLESILNDNYMHMGAMFAKELWEQIGGYDEKIPYPDWDMWAKIAAYGYSYDDGGLSLDEHHYNWKPHHGMDTALIDQVRQELHRRYGGLVKRKRGA